MHLIACTEELAEACAQLGSALFVAVDTEFMREQTFWPKLCLIQMAADGTEVLVDSQAAGLDLAPFFDLMSRWSRSSTPRAKMLKSFTIWPG